MHSKHYTTCGRLLETLTLAAIDRLVSDHIESLLSEENSKIPMEKYLGPDIVWYFITVIVTVMGSGQYV
jgi:hypothetical protein